MDDLKNITAKPKIVELKGETIEVKPVTIGRLAEFNDAIGNLIAQIPNYQDGKIGLNQLVNLYPEAFINAIIVSTDKDPDDIRDMEVEDIIVLGAACIEVNADFFHDAVIPIIFGMTAKVMKIKTKPTNSQQPSGN